MIFFPGYETFSGFSYRARNLFQIQNRGAKHFCQKIEVRNIFFFSTICSLEEFIGVLGILGSFIISMERFIRILGISGSSISSLEEFTGVLGILG